MKPSYLLVGLAASITAAFAQARAPETAPLPAPPPPPPVYPAASVPIARAPVYVYDQKPVVSSGGRSYLISPDQAQSIINRFRDACKEMGNPRFLIYVNRELIDERSGVKLSSHRQVQETNRTSGPGLSTNTAAGTAAPGETARISERVTSTNIFHVRAPKEVPLADRQTTRDIERLFGRPLRMAGAHLTDQRVATQLAESKALDSYSLYPESEQARKDRETLTKAADIVLEILVSSQEAPVSDVSGERNYAAPDIQATAIRLRDAQILGQATSEDLIGKGAAAAGAARTYGIREIAEATALSLMEDMMLK